jgi:ribonuclease P protein component
VADFFIFTQYPATMPFTFSKKEKLKSKKLIEQLFAQGKSVAAFPLRLVYLPIEQENAVTQAGFSVPKKNFKLAVQRNQIKRRLREAYRLQKPLLFNNSTTSYALMFLYLGKKEPSTKELQISIKKLLESFVETTST